MNVPAFDLTRQYGEIRRELLEAVERVLASGQYVLGREVELLESEVAAFVGSRHAVAVASGTDALLLALRALGIGPGDQVLTSPFTFFATASATLLAGATPVFADIEPDSFDLSPAAAGAFLDGAGASGGRPGMRPEKVRALIPVHLYGQPADMGTFSRIGRERGIAVVEDAAQAIGGSVGGVPVGTLGEFGAFSFFPTKNLGAAGDGGLVTTQDADSAGRLRMLRAHGSGAKKYVHEILGTNSRLDALQAAILRVKLSRLPAWNAARLAIARAYDDGLAGLPGIRTPRVTPGSVHVYHQYTIRVERGRRDALANHLAARGIGGTVYYPVPLHLQPALSHLGYAEGDFPEAERAAREVLSLPVFPELRPAEQSLVVGAIREFARA